MLMLMFTLQIKCVYVYVMLDISSSETFFSASKGEELWSQLRCGCQEGGFLCLKGISILFGVHSFPSNQIAWSDPVNSTVC